ncbi:hypothetical protein J6590_039296 [Homalodisca vitripennis]|nr:hypothetical protein J6590_039296 [Homalodisca vitripennis]
MCCNVTKEFNYGLIASAVMCMAPGSAPSTNLHDEFPGNVQGLGRPCLCIRRFTSRTIENIVGIVSHPPRVIDVSVPCTGNLCLRYNASDRFTACALHIVTQLVCNAQAGREVFLTANS